MLYTFTSQAILPHLSPDGRLQFRESDDIEFLARIGKLTESEVRRRLANDNLAFVACYDNEPAAFGWVAAGKAFIGELHHEVVLPLGHRYLWNFRTLEEFRGLGIYPRLLQFIVNDTKHSADRYWILHAPENISSKKGIEKAGFEFCGNVSVKDLDRVFTDAETHVTYALGFETSSEAHASCWMCSSPFMAHKKTSCCCSTLEKVCNERTFVTG